MFMLVLDPSRRSCFLVCVCPFSNAKQQVTSWRCFMLAEAGLMVPRQLTHPEILQKQSCFEDRTCSTKPPKEPRLYTQVHDYLGETAHNTWHSGTNMLLVSYTAYCMYSSIASKAVCFCTPDIFFTPSALPVPFWTHRQQRSGSRRSTRQTVECVAACVFFPRCDMAWTQKVNRCNIPSILLSRHSLLEKSILAFPIGHAAFGRLQIERKESLFEFGATPLRQVSSTFRLPNSTFHPTKCGLFPFPDTLTHGVVSYSYQDQSPTKCTNESRYLKREQQI